MPLSSLARAVQQAMARQASQQQSIGKISIVTQPTPSTPSPLRSNIPSPTISPTTKLKPGKLSPTPSGQTTVTGSDGRTMVYRKQQPRITTTSTGTGGSIAVRKSGSGSTPGGVAVVRSSTGGQISLGSSSGSRSDIQDREYAEMQKLASGVEDAFKQDSTLTPSQALEVSNRLKDSNLSAYQKQELMKDLTKQTSSSDQNEVERQIEQDKLQAMNKEFGFSEAVKDEPRLSSQETADKQEKLERARNIMRNLSLGGGVSQINAKLVSGATNIRERVLASKAKVGSEIEEVSRLQDGLKSSMLIDSSNLITPNAFFEERQSFFDNISKSRNNIVSDYSKFRFQGFDADSSLAREKQKIKEDIVDVTRTGLPGFDYDPFPAIFARASIEATDSREKNIFKTGFSPLDDITKQFAAGSSFATTGLSEFGGEVGKRTTLESYRYGIRDKKLVDSFVKNISEVPSWATADKIKQDFDIKKMDLRLAISPGALTRGKTIDQVSKMREEDLRFIKASDFQKGVDVGEQTGRLAAGIAPYLFPSTAFPKAIADIGASKTKEELITNVLTGATIGAGTRLFSKTGELIPLKLNKLLKGSLSIKDKQLIYGSKLASVVQKGVKGSEKYGLPLVGTGMITLAGTSSVLAAESGDKATARKIEKSLMSSLGGLKIGGIVGGLAGQQLQRPIQKQVLFEKGSQLFSGQKQADFKEQFKYIYGVLPGKETPVKDFKIGELKILDRFSKKDASAIVKVTERTLDSFKPKVIGSGVIVPQTKLTKTPKGRIGDVDVALGTKQLAQRLQTDLSKVIPKGYRVDSDVGTFQGTKKYHISIKDSKGRFLAEDGGFTTNPKKALEFINVGTSLHPTAKQLDMFGNIGEVPALSFVKTPSGTRILNIKTQAKAKLYGGYFGGREKDLIDLKGIIDGTKGLPVKKGVGIKLPGKTELSNLFQNIKSISLKDSLINESLITQNIRSVFFRDFLQKNNLVNYRGVGSKKYVQPKYTTPKTSDYVAPSLKKQTELISSAYKQPQDTTKMNNIIKSLNKTDDYTIPDKPYTPPKYITPKIKRITIKDSIYYPQKTSDYKIPQITDYKKPKITDYDKKYPIQKTPYIDYPFPQKKVPYHRLPPSTKLDYLKIIDGGSYSPPKYKPPRQGSSYTPPRDDPPKEPPYVPPTQDFWEWEQENNKRIQKGIPVFKFFKIIGKKAGGGKRRKQFVGIFPLKKGLNITASKVAETPLRTIKYVPHGVAKTQDDLYFKYSGQFRLPKRTSTLKGKPQARFLVEKSKYAISSPGEIQGIPLKGVAAQRKYSVGLNRKQLGLTKKKRKKK